MLQLHGIATELLPPQPKSAVQHHAAAAQAGPVTLLSLMLALLATGLTFIVANKASIRLDSMTGPACAAAATSAKVSCARGF